LHLGSRDRLRGKEEYVRAARLTAADDKGQLEAADLFDQSSMVQRVLININTSPNAGVICTNGNDAKGRLGALEMFLPEIIGWGLPNDDGLAGLFAVALRAFDFVGPIGDI